MSDACAIDLSLKLTHSDSLFGWFTHKFWKNNTRLCRKICLVVVNFRFGLKKKILCDDSLSLSRRFALSEREFLVQERMREGVPSLTTIIRCFDHSDESDNRYLNWKEMCKINNFFLFEFISLSSSRPPLALSYSQSKTSAKNSSCRLHNRHLLAWAA